VCTPECVTARRVNGLPYKIRSFGEIAKKLTFESVELTYRQRLRIRASLSQLCRVAQFEQLGISENFPRVDGTKVATEVPGCECFYEEGVTPAKAPLTSR
jgi:hypothetical protein